jgi:hypothetical protein
VVWGDPAVERVAAAAVCWVVETDAPVEGGVAGWSALREVQPVTARAAMKTAVAMIRTGRMMTSPNEHDPVRPDSSLGWAGHSMATDGRRGHGELASNRPRVSFQTSTPPRLEPWRRSRGLSEAFQPSWPLAPGVEDGY